jgi:DNA repair protein RadC
MSYGANLPEITLKYKKGTTEKKRITCSDDIFNISKHIFNQDTLELTEEFIVVYLNRANDTLGWIRISQGGISATIVDVRLILSAALQCGATSLILLHNHPSGNMTPSQSDIDLTVKTKSAGKFMDIGVLDHIIVSEDKFYSFADNGLV